MFKNSCVLITGGTGSIGQAFAKFCLDQGANEVRIFSRNKERQIALKQQLQNDNRLVFFQGDIRDISSLEKAVENTDYILHAAAIKYLSVCEDIPVDALEINSIGSYNVIELAIKHGVKKLVCISTDKAVYPTSTMGYTKALMEKIVLEASKKQEKTKLCISRFCNLIISNGSVVPLFFKQISQQKSLTITDPSMIRYFMTTKQAINLIENTFKYGESGDIFIQNANYCTIFDLSQAVIQYMGHKEYPIQVIGSRPGEKKSEQLLTEDEKTRVKLIENGYAIKPYEYNKKNYCETNKMSLQQIIKMIKEENEYSQI